jgi:hypothetical protein
MTILTVVQGKKVDNVIEKAMKYNWSIHETQSMIKQFKNLTVDFRTITRRANRVFNYEFFEGAAELSDLEILKTELFNAYNQGLTRRELSQQFHLEYNNSNTLLRDAIQEENKYEKPINDKGNK